MSEEKKCSPNNRCSDCQEWLKENLAKCEDWEVKRKESYKKFEFRFCQTNSSKGDKVSHPETGGYSYIWERCPDCNKKIKTIKSNGEWGDSTIESEDVDHACEVQANNQIKSNQIKSNQIKSNQIKSNQIKSNQIKSNQSQVSDESLGNNQNKSYLPYILGGVGLVSLVSVLVYFLVRKNNK